MPYHRHWILVAATLAAMPLYGHAAGMQEVPQAPTPAMQGQQMPQSVEEPDAPDDEGTPNEMQGNDIPGASEEAVKAKPETVKPIPPAAPSAPEGDASYDKVILQGLNKVTARAQTIEAPIGSVVRFGTIEIVAHNCWKSAPDERPENAALLEISEIKQGEAPTQIFLGWMFSSSPGLSALEHPFYDVTVVKCEKAEVAPAPAPATAPAKASKKKTL